MVSDQIVLQLPERSGRAVAVSLPCTCGCVCAYSRCPSHAHAHPGTAHRAGKVPPRTADGKFRFPPLAPSRLKLGTPLPAATGAGAPPPPPLRSRVAAGPRRGYRGAAPLPRTSAAAWVAPCSLPPHWLRSCPLGSTLPMGPNRGREVPGGAGAQTPAAAGCLPGAPGTAMGLRRGGRAE